MCSGRAIWRSAAPECQSKFPDRMIGSHPSGDVCGKRAGSKVALVFARWPCTHEGLKNGKTYCWRD